MQSYSKGNSIERATETKLTELQQKTMELDTALKTVEDLSSFRNKIGICEEAVKNKALIERHKSAPRSDIIKFELKEKQITEMYSQLKEKYNTILEQSSKSETLIATITQQTGKISEYKTQLKEYE